MALQLARPHAHLSNRAKVRSALERKPVFKSVLASPFHLTWPSVPVNVQNLALARLVASLENIPSRDASRKFSHQTERNSGNVDSEEVVFDTIQSDPPRVLDRPCTGSVSSASTNLVIGINAVTRALELQLRLTRKRVVVGHPSDPLPPRPTPPPIAVVFVCRADVDPTALIDHIPYLIAGCNSPRNVTQPIRLIPLPKGSEQTISHILGVRRAAVVAFRRGFRSFEALQDILVSVPIVSAPWLCPPDTENTLQLVPTHFKQLRTTAPKDMKGAREQRSKARAAARKNAASSSRSPMRRKPRVTLTTGPESGA